MAAKWLTAAQAETRFGAGNITRYADRNGDGTADTGVVDAAIERAEAMVEAKLLTRYATADLPTEESAASLLLKEIVGGFFLWCLTDAAMMRGQDVFEAHRIAERRLEDVCRATSSLLLAGNPPVDQSAPQVLSAALTTAARLTTVDDGSRGIFNHDSLRDW